MLAAILLRRGAACMLIGASFINIGCDGSGIRETTHPRPELLPVPGGPHVVRQPLPDSPLALADSVRWVRVREQLRNATPGLVLGALEGDGPDVFGQVVAAELDSHGNIYVLDRMNYEVRAFSPSGRFLGAVGGAGDGPTEFRAPFSIALLDEDLLAVVAAPGLIKTFTFTPEGFALRDSYRSAVTPEDLCVSEAGVIAVNWNRRVGDFLLHELQLGREKPKRSFGAGYPAGHWLVQDRMNRGLIACGGEPLRLLFAYQHMPVLAAFARSGDRIWTSRVADYIQRPVVEVNESDGPGVYVDRVVPSDLLATLNVVSPRHAIAQYARSGSTSSLTMQTYLVDLATGHGSWVSDDLPGIVAIAADRFVTLRPRPYSRLTVWHMNTDSGERR